MNEQAAARGTYAVCLLSILFAIALNGSVGAREPSVIAAAVQPSILPSPPPRTMPGPARDPSRIYVANNANNTITTFTTDGDPVSPTISQGVDLPQGLAFDAR